MTICISRTPNHLKTRKLFLIFKVCFIFSRKNKKKAKNCAREKKKEKGSLSYENERSLYQKEVSLKIEEFKLARSNWVASKKEEEIKTNSKEGLNESGAYRGRFNSLKKIGLSTARLREHYQTVKPLRYFTLKPKVSDTNASRSKQEKQWDQPLIEQDSFEEDTMLREKKDQIWDEKESEIKGLVDEALGGKVTEKAKEKKKKKRKGPSKKAIENLKASKHADRVLESCKCNDGKEVTVVIKGFCLCDKGNLKTFKLNKINDDIKKLEKFKPGLEKEDIEPHLVDSIEFHKKQMERKSAMIKQEEEEEEEEKEKKQQDGIKRSKSAKSVSFGPPNTSREIDSKWKSEKNEEKRDQEEEGGKERYEKERMKTEKEETDQEEIRKKQEELRIEQEDMRKKRAEEEKQQEEIRKKLEELSIEQEDLRKNHEEEEQQQEEMRKEKRRKEKEEMVQQEERSGEKNEAESKKLEEKNEKLQNSTDDIASIITIFQNRSPSKSNMALTQEQFEKMKKISE